MIEMDFSKLDGLVPAVVQDFATGMVLMVGFMNQEALNETQKSGKVTFFSRSKKRLWTKGETSGNFLIVKDIVPDCDKDTLLIKADPEGPACHTGSDTCFNETNTDNLQFLQHLQKIINDRHTDPKDESYTSSLFKDGINKIAQKLGEEAVELVIEAKDDNDELFRNEAADLIFHLLVLLEARKIPLSSVIDLLKKRHQAS